MSTRSVVRRGSRGPDVVHLQQQLNARLNPSPRLTPDGIFGGLTDTAVRRFQTDCWLIVDGIVGQATWAAVDRTETLGPILHNVPMIAQPTDTTCWAAATAMMKRSNVPAVIAATPSDLIAPSGGLRNYSGASDFRAGTQRYADAHALSWLPPTSWPPSALAAMLASGPLMFDMLWRSTEYARGNGSPGHMIVVVGIRGDGDPTGKGTTLRLHDPWPPNRGARTSVNFFRWMQEVPTRTYRIFRRR